MTPSRSPTVEITHYEVFGESAAALRTSLNHERPQAVPGGEHDGYTWWRVTWYFSFDNSDRECSLTGIRTRLATQVFLPHWSMPSDPPTALVDKWSRYISALAAHEEGHVQIARDAEAAVRNAVADTPPARSCSKLRKQLDSAVMHAIEEHKEREREYDRTTKHGSTQGARFP